MQLTSQKPIVPAWDWLWLARVTFILAFAALMIYEWNRWPNGSPLLGPIGVIWYNGFEEGIIVFCAISLIAVFACLLKPNEMTAAISFIGILNWLFWGVMALGIGC